MSDIYSNIHVTATDETAGALSAVVKRMTDVNNASRGALEDGITRPAQEGSKAVKELGENVGKYLGVGVGEATEKAGDSLTKFIGKFVTVAAIEEFARRAFTSFATVERGMEQIQFATDATMNDMTRFGAELEAIGGKSGKTVAELQQHVNALMAESGLQREAAVGMLDTIADVNAVTGASFESLSKMAGAAVNNLQLPLEEAKVMMTSWAAEVPSAMLGTFATVAPRLTQTLQNLGFTGKQAGLDIAAIFSKVEAALGNPRAAAASLTDVFRRMGDMSDPIGQRMLPVLDQLQREGKGAGEAMKVLIDQFEEAGGFSKTPSVRASAEKMFNLTPESGNVLRIVKEHWSEINALVARGVNLAEAYQAALAKIAKDAQSSVDGLSSAMDRIETKSGSGIGVVTGGLTAAFGADLSPDRNISAIYKHFFGDAPFDKRAGAMFDALPKKAAGGITSGPSIVGEAGPELVIPLDKLGIGKTDKDEAIQENTAALKRLTMLMMPTRRSAFTPGFGDTPWSRDPLSPGSGGPSFNDRAGNMFGGGFKERAGDMFGGAPGGGDAGGGGGFKERAGTMFGAPFNERAGSMFDGSSGGMAGPPASRRGQAGPPGGGGVTSGRGGTPATSAAPMGSPAIPPKASAPARQKTASLGPAGSSGGSLQSGTDKSGMPIPSDVMHHAEGLAAAGDTQGVFNFIRSQGYHVDSQYCGDFVASIVTARGGKVPPGFATASSWQNYGEAVPAGQEQPGDVAVTRLGTHGQYKGRPVPPGESGGHVGMVGSKGAEGGGKFQFFGANTTHEINASESQFQFRRAVEQHRALRDEMERPIKMNVEAPRVAPQTRATRQRVGRQQARWGSENEMAIARRGAAADTGLQ